VEEGVAVVDGHPEVVEDPAQGVEMEVVAALALALALEVEEVGGVQEEVQVAEVDPEGVVDLEVDPVVARVAVASLKSSPRSSLSWPISRVRR